MSAPTSTYRFQICSEFTLDDAAEQLDHLVTLGVGAVYVSPLLTSTPGSNHGYDWVDEATIDPQRGGEDGWRRFVGRARELGLKIVVDIVPNHMGIKARQLNHAWWDVLTHGRESSFAGWFDIDWAPGKVFLPVLGSDDAVADLVVRDGLLWYFEDSFPLAPGSWTPGDDPVEVHERQHYQLIGWRDEGLRMNYRRFFTITDLAGLRVDDEAVAAATHVRIQRLVDEDDIDGLRIDHPDGLADPGGYLTWLRTQVGDDRWIVVEKILEADEALRPEWPAEGTTGYDALNEVLRGFVDPAAEDAFTADWVARTGDDRDADAQLRDGRRYAATELFRPEVRRITALFDDADPKLTAEALREVAAQMHVYRSYLPLGADDLTGALDRAGSARPELADALARIAPRLLDGSDEAAVRFQQLTGPVVAKGVEDTAFYRYNRFTALNEVGGAPGRFGSSLADFHAAMQRRQRLAPLGMTTLTTHDTKRGEDVRARLAVLAELDFASYAAWVDAFDAATGLDCPPLTVLLAQTLLGASRIEPDRLAAYALKTARESALVTTWYDQDADFEAAVQAAVRAPFEDADLGGAWDALLDQIQAPGESNALAAKLVQLTMPGVPDVYQGTEGFGISLVDPDNRRPVDYAALRAELPSAPPPAENVNAVKLWLTRTALHLRRDHPDWFADYRPLLAEGSAADHLIGFDRGGAIALATRLPVGLASKGGWADTSIQLDGAHVDLLTGRRHDGPRVAVADLFAAYPVALLVVR